PFLFLSGVDANDDIVETLERGADDFLSKPFNMTRLVAKVRATLRLSERRHDALSGPIGPAGALPLLKFCEDSRLSGRLTVRLGTKETRWADFLGGELVLAGGAPEVAGEEPLDLLLAMDSGTYRSEQRRLDPEALRRREDHDVARAQIDRQHDRVLAMLQGLSAEAAPVPVPTAPAAALGVDPSLLAWALSFVAEQVRDHLGAVMTVALLRASYRRVASRRPAVRSFRVAEDGRVIPSAAEALLPPAAVEAVAAWT